MKATMSEPGVLPRKLSVGTLERVSPSRFLSLRRCALQAIWSSLHEPLLPKWPAARLGTVAHQLMEQVGYGKHSADREELEQAWEALVETQEQEMAGSWLERNLVPLSESARDYHVRKYRALGRAFEAAQLFEEADATSNGGSAGRERWVRSKDGKAGGKIDLVVKTNQGIILRDYKTGRVFENDPAICSEGRIEKRFGERKAEKTALRPHRRRKAARKPFCKKLHVLHG